MKTFVLALLSQGLFADILRAQEEEPACVDSARHPPRLHAHERMVRRQVHPR